MPDTIAQELNKEVQLQNPLIKTKKGLELAAAHFIWRKLGWATLDAAKQGIEISFDDLCTALAEFAREH